jgi:predicted metal-dependent hydrolase
MSEPVEAGRSAANVAATTQKIVANMEKVIIGKRQQITLALVAYFCEVANLARKHGLELGALFVKSQRTRWASCSASKNVALNTKLLFLSPELVRYVLIHELCHTVHMNHSHDFWRLVACHEPGYRLLDQALREAWKIVPPWAF